MAHRDLIEQPSIIYNTTITLIYIHIVILCSYIINISNIIIEAKYTEIGGRSINVKRSIYFTHSTHECRRFFFICEIKIE